MSLLSATPRGRSNRRNVVPRLWETLAIAVLAAAVAYALHHLPPLRDHLAAGIAIVLLGTASAALLAGRLGERRQAFALPSILVPTPGAVRPRPLRATDVAFCAALHAETLEHGFFVELGPRFLRRYYAAFLDSPYALGFAATVGGQSLGFLVGTVDARSHARWLVRHRGMTLGLQAIAAMALRPGAALRFLRTRIGRYAATWRRHRGARAPSHAQSEAHTAVLTHVAILSGARRLGAGRVLVREFEIEAGRRGAESAFLTTLGGPNGAGPFYASLGWRRSAQLRTADGRHVEEWTRDLRGISG